MPWRPLNDVIFIEPDPIEKYEGAIVLPDKNSEEKISHYATVVSCGTHCKYKFKTGQRIVIDRFFDKPQYLISEGKKYRLIKEHYVHAVLE